MDDLVRLNKQHIGPASATLTVAFRDYPLLRHAFPDESSREKMVCYYCQTVLHYGIRYGEVYATSPDFKGVAAWITSDYFPLTLWRIIRSVPISIITALGKGGGYRMNHPGK